MSRHNNNTLLSQCLGLVMGVSLLGAVVMGLLALVMGSLGETRGQVFLTLVCLLLGSLLMQVELRARRASKGGTSILLSVGVAVILASQVCFLILVWTDWKTDPFIWRAWWLTMVPSVFVTHVILLHAAAARRGGLAEAITGFFAVWAGLMILYLGMREDMLGPVSSAFLWVGAVPAAGTVLGTLYVLICRFVWTQRPGAGAKRITMAGLVTTSLVVAVAGFYIGRATAPRTAEPAEPAQQPPRMPLPAGGDVDKLPRLDRSHISGTTRPNGLPGRRGDAPSASQPGAAPKPPPVTTAPGVIESETEAPGGEGK